MSATSDSNDTLILDTGLFADRETLNDALQHLNVPATHKRKLTPDEMNDRDWDEILDLVLSTKRVITL